MLLRQVVDVTIAVGLPWETDECLSEDPLHSVYQ